VSGVRWAGCGNSSGTVDRLPTSENMRPATRPFGSSIVGVCRGRGAADRDVGLVPRDAQIRVRLQEVDLEVRMPRIKSWQPLDEVCAYRGE